MVDGGVLIAGAVGIVLMFCLWLEYRHLCKCKVRRDNPYELIDLQNKIRKQKEKENERR